LKTLYRYVSEEEANLIRRTGMIPDVAPDGTPKMIFLTDRFYETAARAKTHLQLPRLPSYRIEIDPSEVPDLSPPKRVDPSANPAWGRGRGTEAYSTGPIRVDPAKLVLLRRRKADSP
jgi:hypothetical protein